jgi:hypothetical protein
LVFVLYTRYSWYDEIKEIELGDAMRTAHMEIIKDIEETEGMFPLRRPKHGWEDNTRVYLAG